MSSDRFYNEGYRREKYMRQPLPRRLGNLASNLNRIATYSNGSFS